MPAKSRVELKAFFKSGSKASQSQYIDLIDSFYGLTGDNSNVLPDVFQRTLFVDENAVPGTGEKGKLNNPFATLGEARLAAQSGDTIIVFPGTYTTGNLFKPGVNYYALEGVTIITSGMSAFAPVLFTDQVGAISGEGGICGLYGRAVIDLQNHTALAASGVSFTEITIECKEIIDNTGGVGAGGLVYGGPSKSIDIKADKIESKSTALFLFDPGAESYTCTIEAKELFLLNNNPFCLLNKGTFNFHFDKVIANTYEGDAPLFVVNNTSKLTIANTLIESNVTKLANVNSGGQLYIDNIKYTTSTDFVGSSVLNIYSPSRIVIKNSEIIETGVLSGIFSLGTGTGEIVVLGVLNTNMPKHETVNILVGEFNYDTSLNSAS